ncbi:hypothetical protein EI171_41310 [Bradyrhizobium sp. LCT2]|nr:hypothetical protein EI171_41310 [Bradyrhizobium sp. LCT2]
MEAAKSFHTRPVSAVKLLNETLHSSRSTTCPVFHCPSLCRRHLGCSPHFADLPITVGCPRFAMFTALTSLLTNRTVWKDAAMTGENSLGRGRPDARRSTTFRRAPATRWSSSGSNASIRPPKPLWIHREMSPVRGQPRRRAISAQRVG